MLLCKKVLILIEVRVPAVHEKFNSMTLNFHDLFMTNTQRIHEYKLVLGCNIFKKKILLYNQRREITQPLQNFATFPWLPIPLTKFHDFSRPQEPCHTKIRNNDYLFIFLRSVSNLHINRSIHICAHMDFISCNEAIRVSCYL